MITALLISAVVITIGRYIIIEKDRSARHKKFMKDMDSFDNKSIQRK